MDGLVEVPEDMAWEIAEEDWNPWPWVTDRDSEIWAVTPYTHNGERVLAPFASNVRPATRASVEAAYGPLTDEPHCPVCGTTLFWRDGVCGFRLDTIKHPTR